MDHAALKDLAHQIVELDPAMQRVLYRELAHLYEQKEFEDLTPEGKALWFSLRLICGEAVKCARVACTAPG